MLATTHNLNENWGAIQWWLGNEGGFLIVTNRATP
jgi:hypothetical protein